MTPSPLVVSLCDRTGAAPEPPRLFADIAPRVVDRAAYNAGARERYHADKARAAPLAATGLTDAQRDRSAVVAAVRAEYARLEREAASLRAWLERNGGA